VCSSDLIVSGVATWPDGQSLDVCQAQINEWGLSAFLSESQHEITADGGLFDHLVYRHCARADVPDLVRVVVWCDPAVTATDQSDSNGIQVDGLAADGTIYRLYSSEQRSTPEQTIRLALLKAVEYGADHIGIETDQGGETWRSVVLVAWNSLVESDDHPHITAEMERPRMKSAKAGSIGSKAHRASQMLAAYERGELMHVIGTHATLEAALNRFPKSKPYDLVDAAYWSWRDLAKGGVQLL
jgi:phage terminase large subunit-like protein